MAQLTIVQIYNGGKYNIMSAVVSEYLKNGKPKDYDERTWIELLIVKHSINTAHALYFKATAAYSDNITRAAAKLTLQVRGNKAYFIAAVCFFVGKIAS